MTTHTTPTDALAGAAQSTSDDSVRRALVDGLRTRVAILRSLSLPTALHERAQVVAFGAETAHARLTEELRTLYRHAGLLLEAATPPPTCPTCDGDVAHPGVEPCTDCGTVCVHDAGCRESNESCVARDARADREYAWWVEQQDRRKGGE